MTPLLAWAMFAALQPSDGPACNPEGSQMEMTACAHEAFDRTDAELNRLWREIIAGAREDDRSPNNGSTPEDDRSAEAILRTAQRAWVAFRDAHCEYDAMSERGGSLEPMIYDECRARLTRGRIAQLRGEQESQE